jgi:hypothetical protein
MRRREGGTDRGVALEIRCRSRWPAPGNSRPRPMRRPRVCLASRLPGGAGAPPGGTTAPRQELADVSEPSAQAPAARNESAARRRSWVHPWRSPRGAPGGAAPGPSIPERERPESAFPAEATPPRGAPAPRRRPALHSPRFGEGGKRKEDEGLPGADTRMRAMMLGCLKLLVCRGAACCAPTSPRAPTSPQKGVHARLRRAMRGEVRRGVSAAAYSAVMLSSRKSGCWSRVNSTAKPSSR